MTIWIIAVAVAIYFILGALLALEYFQKEGKYDPPLECFGIMTVMFVMGVAFFVCLGLKMLISRLNRWRKTRDTPR